MTQRTNRIEGFGAFVESWQNPAHPENRALTTLRTTPYGNINVTGTLGDYRGHALSRWHLRFVDALEPGVRDLVLVLVEQYNWVTYSSCEGHHYGRLSHAPVERRVGIYPRSTGELNVVFTTLSQLRRSVNRRHLRSSVRLEVITDPLDTDGRGRAAVDLVFRRRARARWASYFKDLDAVYRDAVAALTHRSGRDRS